MTTVAACFVPGIFFLLWVIANKVEDIYDELRRRK